MKTLSLVSQKGGSGRTTLSLHLAVAAERAGLMTAIVDLDPQASAWKWSQRRKGQPPEVITAVAEQLEELKRKASEGLDLLIIDSAPHADRAALMACKAADHILIPARASILDLDALTPVLDLVEMARKPATAVLNGVSTSTSVDVDEAKEVIRARGVDLYPEYIHERVAFKRALIAGQTVQEVGADPKATREIEGLFSWVCATLNLTMTEKAA
ncbi:ParA family protein [Methylobacterium sp. Leaf466]|uniref:ParA family protein n=1 Tax=Methylobacterium sp. Leaf466 TaxID=1736386 RepID=UPI0009E7094B|nr:ParA family protein [Methylobacterium sp. Leaf466]